MAAEQRLLIEQLFGREGLYNSHSSSSSFSSSYDRDRNGNGRYGGGSGGGGGGDSGSISGGRGGRSAPMNLTDHRICKSFLVGTCPHDLFIGTKEDMGRCKKLHLEKYKIMYESEKRKYEKHLQEQQQQQQQQNGKSGDSQPSEENKDDSNNNNSQQGVLGPAPISITNPTSTSNHNINNKAPVALSEEDERIKRMIEQFEYEHMRNLEYYIDEVNHKIDIAEENLKHTAEEQAKIDQVAKDLDNMDIRIGLLTQEIELLVASQKQVTKALIETNKLNELLKKRSTFAAAVRELSDNIGQAGQQKLEVCNVCGAYLSRLDSDRRLADHFIGKIHLSYVQMRKALKQLKTKHAHNQYL